MGILRLLFSKGESILPAFNSPFGSRPTRFRRERVLVVGCGDVGLRAAAQGACA
jgi:hypothetical protein